MGFSVMLWGAEKLVPAEYWCPVRYSLQNVGEHFNAALNFYRCFNFYIFIPNDSSFAYDVLQRANALSTLSV